MHLGIALVVGGLIGFFIAKNKYSMTTASKA